MMISLDAEKAFDKIQHLLMIKTLTKVGTEGTYLNIIKGIYNKSTIQHDMQQWKFESPSTKFRNKTRMPTLTTSIQIVMEILATAIRQENEIKVIQTGREDIKMVTICRWHDTLYRESQSLQAKIIRTNK